MSLFRGARERRASDPLFDQLWKQRRGGASAPGRESAERLTAWFAAVELVASTGSSLPLDQIDGPASPLFLDPSDEVATGIAGWLHQMLESAAKHGNAYARVRQADRMGYPVRADTIDARTVAWRWTKADGWQVRVEGELVKRWPLGDLLHVPVFLQAGCPVGLNPIEHFKETLGIPVLARKFGADFFEAGGHPVGIVHVTGDPGEDGSKRTKAKFKAAATDREVVVMSDIAKYEKLSVDPSDSQFLETMRFGIEEIARIVLGGFPEMVGGSVSGQNVTYANREQKVADFLAFSLQSRYLVPFEHAFSRWTPGPQRVRFNVDALLRADLEARYKSYLVAAQIGTQSGTPLLTTNEMRELEDMDPIDGGDTFAPPRQPTAPRPDPAREDT